MKKEMTQQSVSKKILGICLECIAFFFGAAAYLLRVNLKVSRNTEEDTTTDGLFKELYKKNPSLFDPRPPKDR